MLKFCRNCLSKWYKSAADEAGIEVSMDEARERIYGMPYNEWKKRYQKEATPEQLAAFEARRGSPTKSSKGIRGDCCYTPGLCNITHRH